VGDKAVVREFTPIKTKCLEKATPRCYRLKRREADPRGAASNSGVLLFRSYLAPFTLQIHGVIHVHSTIREII
jgi:hypothetical protein